MRINALLRHTPLLICLLCVAVWSGCPPVDPPDTDPTTFELFDELWETFDANYSYFVHKGIDWDWLWVEYADQFDDELTASEFAARVAPMLNELHDWHVWVQAPGEDPIGYAGSYTPNFPTKLYPAYSADGKYSKLGDNVIYHAWLHDNIAYISVDTLATDAFATVADADIEAMFHGYRDADAMIIDIRANNGGNENNAIKIASRFTEVARVYGHTRTRDGADHADFAPLVDKTLEPSTGTRFDGPVACLIGKRCMSSAEWFTLMMRACPNVTLIGDGTRGASGNPETFTLDNGVVFAVSRWVAYTDDMEIIEDAGIAPDIAVDPDHSVDDDHDYVLEAAIEALTGGR